MKYINIKDTDKIQKGVEEFKKQLMDFSKPEDLPVLYKEVKKTIPWYRRKDFFAYMTYIVLSNTQGGNQRPQDAQNARRNVQDNVASQKNAYNNQKKPASQNVASASNASNTVMWTNYSPRNAEAQSEFKKFIVTKASIDPSSIVEVAPKRFCSFVTFKDQDSLNKAISAVNNQTFDNRVVKANYNNAKA